MPCIGDRDAVDPVVRVALGDHAVAVAPLRAGARVAEQGDGDAIDKAARVKIVAT